MNDNRDLEQIKVREDEVNKNSTSKKKWITLVIVLLLITNICTFFIVNLVSFNGSKGKVIISRETYDDILKYKKVFIVRNKLYEYYDGAIDDKVLVNGAVKGMRESLKNSH